MVSCIFVLPGMETWRTKRVGIWQTSSTEYHNNQEILNIIYPEEMLWGIRQTDMHTQPQYDPTVTTKHTKIIKIHCLHNKSLIFPCMSPYVMSPTTASTTASNRTPSEDKSLSSFVLRHSLKSYCYTTWDTCTWDLRWLAISYINYIVRNICAGMKVN